MKLIKHSFYLFTLLFVITACDTHRDYEIDYTPIAPLGGQYRIYVYDEDGEEILKDYCYMSNTSGYDTDKCWIRIGESHEDPGQPWAINGKIDCDVRTLTFSGTDIENLAGNVASSEETFNLTNGTLLLDGATTPSQTITDKIRFTFRNSRFPGKTYTAEGYRYTGWSGD